MNKIHNKRKGPDVLVTWLKYSNIILWALVFIVIFFADIAKPEKKTFFDHLLSVDRPPIWNEKQLTIAFIVAIVLLIFATVSLIFNFMRNKRETDHIHKSIVFSLILSVISIYIVGNMLFF